MNTCYRQRQTYKDEIREKFNNTCQMCGNPGHDVDHIIPFAISHNSSRDNLRVLCHQCNVDTRRPGKNSNLPLNEWYQYLAKELHTWFVSVAYHRITAYQ